MTDIKMPLRSEIIDINFKGHKYSLEHYYYEGTDGQRYTTTELDQEFFDRLYQLHRDRQIGEVLKKN